MTNRHDYVYCIFDDADNCLYVGMTGYVGPRGLRWYQHKRTNPEMVSRAVRFKLYGPFTRNGATKVERTQLLLRRPEYNSLPKWLIDRADEYLTAEARA